MTPAIASVIPLFILLRNARLIDTLLGLVIVYTVSNLPLVIWVMKGFFEDLPVDMEESSLSSVAPGWRRSPASLCRSLLQGWRPPRF